MRNAAVTTSLIIIPWAANTKLPHRLRVLQTRGVTGVYKPGTWSPRRADPDYSVRLHGRVCINQAGLCKVGPSPARLVASHWRVAQIKGHDDLTSSHHPVYYSSLIKCPAG